MPFLKVTGIILGNKTDCSKEKEVIELCKIHNIKMYKAKCSENHFEITIEPIYEVEEKILNPSEIQFSQI